MATLDTDSFAGTGEFRYLYIAGIYYKWDVGVGWVVVEEANLPNMMMWQELQPAQRVALEPELPK